MARALRVIRPGEDTADEQVSMEDALQDMIAIVAADRPVVVMMLWEKPDGSLTMASLPGAHAVKIGLVDAASKALFPDDKDD